MPKYLIRILPEALQDINEVDNYIAYELFNPLGAKKYRMGIFESIYKLAIYGASVVINSRESIQRRYGPNARTIPYKKMTIVYNIIGDVILIRRVMASSLIL